MSPSAAVLLRVIGSGVGIETVNVSKLKLEVLRVSDRILSQRSLDQGQAVAEGGAQGGALVVVAGQEEDRAGERGQDVLEQGVIGRRAAIGEVAGQDDAVERRPEGREVGHDLAGRRRRVVADQRGFLPVGEDVEVRDMGDQGRHAPASRAIPRKPAVS